MRITFSHDYDKMLNNSYKQLPKKAILLEVFVKDSEELHPHFIEYDTIYLSRETCDYEYYKLPKGDVIILLLKSEFDNGDVMLWTTIRRFNPKKFQYYNNLRGQDFEIIIKEGREYDNN